MAERVDSTKIESIVGVVRDPVDHYAREVSTEQTVYILHSQACLDSGIDLLDCAYSLALDKGIDTNHWVQDVPTRVIIRDGELLPHTHTWHEAYNEAVGYYLTCECGEDI